MEISSYKLKVRKKMPGEEKIEKIINDIAGIAAEFILSDKEELVLMPFGFNLENLTD